MKETKKERIYKAAIELAKQKDVFTASEVASIVNATPREVGKLLRAFPEFIKIGDKWCLKERAPLLPRQRIYKAAIKLAKQKKIFTSSEIADAVGMTAKDVGNHLRHIDKFKNIGRNRWCLKEDVELAKKFELARKIASISISISVPPAPMIWCWKKLHNISQHECTRERYTCGYWIGSGGECFG